ncbi:MAG: hypothetical protein JNK67_10265 [Alphaproteobacteria bacterium]|nr:hypothetical protein [Alphaproteobacteria bacterium]
MPAATRPAACALGRVARRLAVGAAAIVAVAVPGIAYERLSPYAGGHYVNAALGFAVELPRDMVACQLPADRWREGIVLLPGRGASCAALDRVVAIVTVSGEPNTESLGDVDSLAASVCAHPTWGPVRVQPARRAVAGLATLSCVIQEESGTVAIEVVAQRATAGPAATWTNLRATLLVRGDRWLEFTRLLDDVVARIGLLSP